MAGPWFFAWVGGILYPPFAMNTTGDVWGGSIETVGDVWGGSLTTEADVAEDSDTLTDIANTENLIVGNTYFVTGPGIPTNDDGSPMVTATYTGGTSIRMSALAEATTPAASVRFLNTAQTAVISNVSSTAQLVVGRVYGIAGSGLNVGTTFTFDGTNTFHLSQPATSTSRLTRLTISSDVGTNVIQNLGSTAGLIVGQVYSIWGPGIPAGTTFTFEGSNTITISGTATVSNQGVFLSIKKGITEDDGGAFDVATMLRYDETILDIVIEHTEGEFPTLKVDVRNPEMGLLNSGNKLWCWLAWDSAWSPLAGYTTNPANVIPLFHGRIIGVPQRLTDEVVTMQFVAKPLDFFAQKQAIAASLQVAPYWDPIWVQKKINDPDTALEAYTVRWHIDRLTLQVTTSDLINAEDGTLTIDETGHFYDGIDVSYSESPLTSVSMQATVTWTQTGEGDVDLTSSIVQAFRAAGSPFTYPIIGSYTSDGLLSSWPKAGNSFSGGWSVGQFATAVDGSEWQNSYYITIKYTAGGGDISTSTLPPAAQQAVSPLMNSGPYGTTVDFFSNPLAPNPFFFWQSRVNWDITLSLDPISINFPAHYLASRKRSEVLVFTLNADVQSVLVNPDGTDTEIIELSSNFVDQLVDPGGALPIGDLRRNSYFTTDRGQQSLQWLLLYARAALISRSRVVQIKFQCHWSSAILAITCRKSVLLQDRRLPGGQALGKIVYYSFKASGDGGNESNLVEIHIACAVGLGDTLPAPVSTADTYATGYANGYTQKEPGSQIDVIPGALQYQSLAGTFVLDDDGVDLFNMVPATVVKSLTIFNGPNDQLNFVEDAARQYGDPVGGLQAVPTQIDLELVPVTGGDFYTQIPVATSNLTIPKMIDLSAPAG